MKRIFHLTMIILSMVLTMTISACKPAPAEPGKGTPYPQVTIPGSQIRKMHSTATGRDYDLYIRLPDEYEKYPKVTYPVLYLLDAQWDYKMLDSIYGSLQYDGFIPELIIVGITYSGEKPDYNTLRAMDYTPVQEKNVTGSGDAPKFLSFIKEQVIPFVDSNFHVRPGQRVLMGSSYGGTFTLYTLFTDPALFSGYVAASPVTVYGNRFAFDQEAAYYQNHKDLSVRLYISVGEKEDLMYPVKQYIDVLKGRNYEGLALETRVIEGDGHASSKTEGFNRGLRFMFQE